MSSKVEIKENQVFVHDGQHRRVVTIFNNVVCYSTGADTSRLCKVKTFRRWVNKINREKSKCQ